MLHSKLDLKQMGIFGSHSSCNISHLATSRGKYDTATSDNLKRLLPALPKSNYQKNNSIDLQKVKTLYTFTDTVYRNSPT